MEEPEELSQQIAYQRVSQRVCCLCVLIIVVFGLTLLALLGVTAYCVHGHAKPNSTVLLQHGPQRLSEPTTGNYSGNYRRFEETNKRRRWLRKPTGTTEGEIPTGPQSLMFISQEALKGTPPKMKWLDNTTDAYKTEDLILNNSAVFPTITISVPGYYHIYSKIGFKYPGNTDILGGRLYHNIQKIPVTGRTRRIQNTLPVQQGQGHIYDSSIIAISLPMKTADVIAIAVSDIEFVYKSESDSYLEICKRPCGSK